MATLAIRPLICISAGACEEEEERSPWLKTREEMEGRADLEIIVSSVVGRGGKGKHGKNQADCELR